MTRRQGNVVAPEKKLVVQVLWIMPNIPISGLTVLLTTYIPALQNIIGIINAKIILLCLLKYHIPVSDIFKAQ